MSGCDFLPIGDVRVVRVRKSSPCALKTPQIWRFCACWASFSRKSRWRGRAGRVFSRQSALCRPWKQLDALQTGGGGGLRHAKPSGGASPACRRLGWRHSPGWWRRGRASRWCGRPNCRPPRPLLPIYIVFRRGGLRFGQNGVVRDVLFAREPAIASLSPLYRT